MKFFCEYCGCRIDAEKDRKCPNCGASYKKNETFIRLEKERKDKIDQINKLTEQTFKSKNKVSLIATIIIISICIIVFIFVMLSIMKTREDMPNLSTQNESQIEVNDTNTQQSTEEEIIIPKNEKVTVGINEYGKTLNYQVKVTGYETVTYWYKEAKKGYEFVKFNLMVENLTNKQIKSEDVNCIVDNVAQDNELSSGYSTLPFFIASELTVKGEATFEVPKDATSYDIRYGDYVTIHIEK